MVGDGGTTTPTGTGGAIRDNRTVLRVLAWFGPLVVFGIFAGWGIIGGFLPPPSPAESADEIAELYRENADLDRVGLMISMCGAFCVIPFSLAISLMMRRAERGTPILSIFQFASSIVTALVLIIPTLIFLGASFRPERAPEITQMLNDVSYIMIILPFPPVVAQVLSVAFVTLGDERRRPVFPRWVGYYNLWAAVLVLPVVLLMFWQSGPLAWNGVIGFWIAAAAFGNWYPIMTWAILRALRQEEQDEAAEREAAAAVDGFPDRPGPRVMEVRT